ncbi:MAG: hypothetical protein CYG59_17555 [Chloroflexi bacterium]|nr:MAG: hypothetical protein CYG59_17555 [Chloroflexota bacterium]
MQRIFYALGQGTLRSWIGVEKSTREFFMPNPQEFGFLTLLNMPRSKRVKTLYIAMCSFVRLYSVLRFSMHTVDFNL